MQQARKKNTKRVQTRRAEHTCSREQNYMKNTIIREQKGELACKQEDQKHATIRHRSKQSQLIAMERARVPCRAARLEHAWAHRTFRRLSGQPTTDDCDWRGPNGAKRVRGEPLYYCKVYLTLRPGFDVGAVLKRFKLLKAFSNCKYNIRK